MTGFSNVGKAAGFAGIGSDGQPEGDLTGSYPNPLVVGMWNNPIDPRMPDNGDTLIYNGGEWIPTPSPTSTTFFQGVWDANANTPDIENFPGLSDGYVWIVSVAGNTDVGGITGWVVGDYAVYSSGNWYKLSNNSFGWGLTGNNGTSPAINYVGTADARDFVIRANASEVFRAYLTGGARISGSLLVSDSLQVTNNITGSNAKLMGDLAVCGGDITTNVAVFNLLNGVTTRINIGNSAACNWISGSTRFPQGISGSLTRLVDGTSAFVADVGMLVTSSSNGSVVFKVDDSKFAALSGSTFTGVASFNSGLSGSLTKLTDGTSYFVAGVNTTVTSGSNGSITIAAIPNGLDTHIQFNDGGFFRGDAGLTYNKTTDSLTISGDLAVNGDDLTTTSATFKLINNNSTTVHFAGGATQIEIGSNSGTTSINNDLTVDGSATLGNNVADNTTITGDLAVNGGDLTTTSATFNLVNGTATTVNLAGGATLAVNIGNVVGTNIISGTTKLPQGLSGSLTKLTDGTSYLIAGNNTTVVTGSTGNVTVTAIPSGVNTNLQFNSSGSFAGSNLLTWDGGSLVVSGSIVTTGAVNASGGVFGDLFLPPGPIQTVTADATTISPTTSYHRLTAAANYTITNTPSINFSNAVVGSVLFLQVVLGSAGSITFTRGAATRLSLGANTRKLNAGGSLQLIYDGAYWIEMFFNTATSL
jgi:hypothetical protein